jgi:hypothetical protein
MAIGLEPLGEPRLAAVEAMLGDPDVLRFTRVPEQVPPGFPRAWLGLYEELMMSVDNRARSAWRT